MSAILDILIVVIIGVTIGFAVKNGFVKTVLSAASFLIALAVAFLFVAPVRDAFLETMPFEEAAKRVESGMAVKVRTAVDESITSFVTDTSEEQAELPEFLTKLEFIGIDKDELQTKWNDWRSGNTETLKNELVGYVSEPVLRAVATFTAFILLYLGSVLVLRLAAYLLDKLTDLPILRQANKLLGLAAGVVLALLRVWLFCAVVRLLLPCADTLGLDFVSRIDPSATFLFKFFYENNFFNFFFS